MAESISWGCYSCCTCLLHSDFLCSLKVEINDIHELCHPEENKTNLVCVSPVDSFLCLVYVQTKWRSVSVWDRLTALKKNPVPNNKQCSFESEESERICSSWWYVHLLHCLTTSVEGKGAEDFAKWYPDTNTNEWTWDGLVIQVFSCCNHWVSDLFWQFI